MAHIRRMEGITMLKALRLFKKDEKGQAVVEMAITLPLLMLILCAILDFGWLMSNQMIVDECSREGARYGIVNASAGGAASLISAHVISTAPSFISNLLSVSVTFSNPSNPTSGDVTVQVSCNVKSLTPLSGILAKSGVTNLSSACTMQAEQ